VSDLRDKVLKDIASRGLAPKPARSFLARRSAFWLLAGLSVFFGALATALLLFIVGDQFSTGGRGFDEMPFDDLAPAIPAALAALTLLFAVSARLCFANTRRGYLYRPSAVIGIAAALSLGLGALANTFEAGGAIDRFLRDHVPAYAEFAQIPYGEWSRPDAGRLGGAVLAAEGGILTLRAFDREIWRVDISGAEIALDNAPVDEGDVAVTGVKTGKRTFKASRVEPFD
jgi:hypothetical protein